jgi:hypothetical protein
MASHPDTNPDSAPDAPSDDVERVSPTHDPRRESVENMPDSDAADDTDALRRSRASAEPSAP